MRCNLHALSNVCSVKSERSPGGVMMDHCDWAPELTSCARQLARPVLNGVWSVLA